MKSNSLKFVVLVLLASVFSVDSYAQLVLDQMPRGVYYERTARIRKFKDMKNMRDVFHSDKLLMGRNVFSGNVFYTTGRLLVAQTDDKNDYQWRHALGLFSRIRFFEEYSLNTTFYKDFNKKADLPWVSDFTYSIGRYQWRPDKFNYGYENYQNNKYTDSWDELYRKFLRGNYFISYSHLLPDSLMKRIQIDSTSQLKVTYFARYALYYIDESGKLQGGGYHGKPSVGLSLRYSFLKNFYVEGAAYYYPIESHKQKWDPDFTYGFGYFDWRSFRVSVTYGNWATNRFPWNKKEYSDYGFLDGQLKVAFNFIW